jgi:homoserine O-acetyltransferase/O-succinyltransferase
MRLYTAFLAVAVLGSSATGQVNTASLGRCRLELGGVIENCRVAYRTFGKLNDERTNGILIPTWFASGADNWLPLLGPRGVVDTAGFFVVVIESLGAASSSSASNSDGQSGLSFPEITIGDMVQASHRLVADHLKLPELFGVVGISLGGLQAFEWGVRYPGFARRLVPIEGGPRQAIYGRAIWELIARACEDGLRGSVSLDSTTVTLARISILAMTSPAAANRRPASTYNEYLTAQARQLRTANLYDWLAHARAILRHDISRTHAGDIAEAARRWKAKTFIIVAAHDHSIDPQPALEFARLIRADTMVIHSPSGHSAIFSDSAAKAAVREFLRR